VVAKSADAFRTISEVSELLDTPAHVLRFWESRFTQVKPVKRAGGRRYYRPADVALLSGIRKLLHDDGMTIRGVQKLLKENGVGQVAEKSGMEAAELAEPPTAEVAAKPRPAAPKQPEPARPEVAEAPMHLNAEEEADTAADADEKIVQLQTPVPVPEPVAAPAEPEIAAADLPLSAQLRRMTPETLAQKADALAPLYHRLAALRARMAPRGRTPAS
jgi:DNA-binding transcriptional MerR regulator